MRILRWETIFDNYGIKVVTKTDKNKGAYVLNKEQVNAISKAGIKPASARPAPGFEVGVLFDNSLDSVEASYYLAERSTSIKERPPEPRLGHQIISEWARIGDKIIIGNVGPELFVARIDGLVSIEQDIPFEIADKISKDEIEKRAAKVKGKPGKRSTNRQEYIRNPWVIAAVIKRSGNKCEMPGCTAPLFKRENDTPYLEVHHIVPLAEDGDDTVANAAAVCPACHRELHFGKRRHAKRASLAKRITPR
jgi:hypothetical protein